MRFQIPQMLKGGGGSIVNCSSVAGLVGAPYLSAYVASKHGIIGLTKSAALEYAKRGIRVNAVCPAFIDTPLSRESMTPEHLATLLAELPIGRLAQSAEGGSEEHTSELQSLMRISYAVSCLNKIINNQ